MKHYHALVARISEIHDLDKSAAVLSWDREVNMPAAGNEARTQQLATLRRLIHKLFTADETGELIKAAAAELEEADYDSNEASLVRYLRRSYADERKLPADFVTRSTTVAGQALKVWKAARENDDFASFEPWLEKVVALCQEKAELYGYEDEKYDALLDKFERDATTAEVRALFAAAKEALVPLREAIDDRGRPVEDGFLHLDYPIDAQKAFARDIARAVGYDFERGHIGTATHPFATSFSRNDVRITTRWYPEFINASIFGTLHESGHAMYEQGTHPSLARTPLARGTSSGVHESQSRMIENIVGRSAGFWSRYFPKLQGYFPQQLGNVSAGQFYRAVNKVQSSCIRVEADELTYNLHIILRFELEQALLNEELSVGEVPTAWNDKMQTLLGVVPTDNSSGCLQDTHWALLLFGYFPTYALGNLYAAQFYEAAVAQSPEIADQMADGETKALVNWLRENIHQHGRKFTPGELVQRVTGKPLSHKAFVRRMSAKFGEIYQL